MKRGGLQTGIIFVVGPQVRSIDLSVPSFWLRVTGDRTVPIKAMAIVSQAATVRVAASGFSVANKMRGVPIKVDAFRDVAEARLWLDQVM